VSCRPVERSVATAHSYAMDLLRWFRFVWSIECCWDRADRTVARDFCRWMMVAARPGQSRRGLSASVRAHTPDSGAQLLPVPPGSWDGPGTTSIPSLWLVLYQRRF